MRKLDFSRTFFQLLALGLFVYQLQNSIFKYKSGPIVQQTSTTTTDANQKPVIYLSKRASLTTKRQTNLDTKD